METEPVFAFSADQEYALKEAHARPSLRVEAPCRIAHLAFQAQPETIGRLLDGLAPDRADPAPRHLIAEFDAALCKFERHTEFCSLTWLRAGPSAGLLLPEALAALLPRNAVEPLVLLDIEIVVDPAAFAARLSDRARVLGGVFAGSLLVRTTLAPRPDGAIAFHLLAEDAEPNELGRRIQRLIEMETYRTMCLLGLPMARRASERVGALENQLEAVAATLRRADFSDAGREEAIFDELSSLSAEVSALSAETRFRFAASRAYYDLVRQRLEALGEEQVLDRQSITGFVLARLNPAMATIESAGRREETLAEDVMRALTLLRTRIELNLNRANQSLLKSMDERHRQQVKISEAVESLSTVAITYYGVGLLAYVIGAALAVSDLGLEPLAVALSVPVVFAGVWLVLRRARARWARRPEPGTADRRRDE